MNCTQTLMPITITYSKTTEGRWLAVELCEDAPANHVVSEDRSHVASCDNEGDAAFIAQAPLIVERLVCALRASWAREDALLAKRWGTQ